MPKPGKSGLIRIKNALGYSMSGLRMALLSEAAFRQELALALVLTPVALWLGDTPLEIALLIIPVWLVLIVELLNSAIEAVVDRVSPDCHELAKRAKDMGSAAVLLSIILSVACWFGVFIPRWL